MKSWRKSFAAVATIATLSTMVAASVSSAAQGGGRGACRADMEKLCPDAKRGDGSRRQCMQDHKDELSDACKQKMAHWGEHRQDKANEHNSGGGSQDDGAAE